MTKKGGGHDDGRGGYARRIFEFPRGEFFGSAEANFALDCGSFVRSRRCTSFFLETRNSSPRYERVPRRCRGASKRLVFVVDSMAWLGGLVAGRRHNCCSVAVTNF